MKQCRLRTEINSQQMSIKQNLMPENMNTVSVLFGPKDITFSNIRNIRLTSTYVHVLSAPWTEHIELKLFLSCFTPETLLTTTWGILEKNFRSEISQNLRKLLQAQPASKFHVFNFHVDSYISTHCLAI